MVIPSECQETLSYSALESFSSGKPVIATTVGGLPEIVIHEETGLLVPPASPAALGSAMRRLWQEPGLTRKLGAKALKVARETYSLDRQVQRTVELYSELCARRSSDAAVPTSA
jgi:glycosyltransferase involved in cell wall biosynthesis